jgi:hypothetical protein
MLLYKPLLHGKMCYGSMLSHISRFKILEAKLYARDFFDKNRAANRMGLGRVHVY